MENENKTTLKNSISLSSSIPLHKAGGMTSAVMDVGDHRVAMVNVFEP